MSLGDRAIPRSPSAARSAGTGSIRSTSVPNASIVTASRSAKRIRVEVARNREELRAHFGSRLDDLGAEDGEVALAHGLELARSRVAAEVRELRSAIRGREVVVGVQPAELADRERPGWRCAPR